MSTISAPVALIRWPHLRRDAIKRTRREAARAGSYAAEEVPELLELAVDELELELELDPAIELEALLPEPDARESVR